MASGDLVASWDRTRGHLARAWVELQVGSETDAYREYLDHNELGLAMEALADAANAPGVPSDFWEALADAADEMRLNEVAVEYRRRASATK